VGEHVCLTIFFFVFFLFLATIVSLQPNLTNNGGGEQSTQHAADAMLNDVIDAFSEGTTATADSNIVIIVQPTCVCVDFFFFFFVLFFLQ
jgi:hypothetical protein